MHDAMLMLDRRLRAVQNEIAEIAHTMRELAHGATPARSSPECDARPSPFELVEGASIDDLPVRLKMQVSECGEGLILRRSHRVRRLQFRSEPVKHPTEVRALVLDTSLSGEEVQAGTGGWISVFEVAAGYESAPFCMADLEDVPAYTLNWQGQAGADLLPYTTPLILKDPIRLRAGDRFWCSAIVGGDVAFTFRASARGRHTVNLEGDGVTDPPIPRDSGPASRGLPWDHYRSR